MEKMTEAELMTKLNALELPEGDERIKSITCSLIGHSKIVDTFFGEVYCGRCKDKIGDTLTGIYNLQGNVIVGHNCETCQSNYEKLGWEDKLFVPDPFAVEEVAQDDN